MRQGAGGEERVLVDPTEFASDESAAVELLGVARDGSRIAYAVRAGGTDEITVRFRDVDSGRDLPHVLPKARYFGVQLLGDGRRFVCTRFDADGPRVFLRSLGEDDRAARSSASGTGRTRSSTPSSATGTGTSTIHVLQGSAGEKTELWLLDLEAGGDAVPVSTELDATFHGEVRDGRLYLATNHEAPERTRPGCDAADPDPAHWTEVVPEHADAVIEGVSYVGGRLLVHRLEDVQSRVRMFDPVGADLGEIRLEGIGTVAAIQGTWASDEIYLGFTSFHVPNTVYRVNLETGSSEVWFRPELPIATDGVGGGADPHPLEGRHRGARVPRPSEGSRA